MDKIENFLNYELQNKNEIPNIPLYIDQVTSYLEDVFSDLRLNDEDKVLTKTMINNYVKAQVISSPIKKKYNKEQIMKLKMLYLLKNTLSLSQIDDLFQESDDLEALYDYFIACDGEGRAVLKKTSPATISEKDIFKLLLSSQLQKKYAELLLEQIKMSRAEEKQKKDKADKKKKTDEVK